MARDLDARLVGGSFFQRKSPNDHNRHGRDVPLSLVNEDFGGDSAKWTLRLLDVFQPCSNKSCSIFFSSEQAKPEDKKPGSDHWNYGRQLATVGGYEGIASLCVVRCGKRHVAVPE